MNFHVTSEKIGLQQHILGIPQILPIGIIMKTLTEV